MGKVQKKEKQSADLRKLVEKSTEKSGVPLKVQDAATLNRLRLLLSEARRSQQARD